MDNDDDAIWRRYAKNQLVDVVALFKALKSHLELDIWWGETFHWKMDPFVFKWNFAMLRNFGTQTLIISTEEHRAIEHKIYAQQNDAMPLLKIGKHFENYLKEMIKLLETFLIIVLSLQRTFAHHEHHKLHFCQAKTEEKENDY